MFEKIKKNVSFAITLHKKSYLQSLKDAPTSTPSIWSKIYYKQYPRFPAFLLPTENKLPKRDFFASIIRRTSSRDYKGQPIDISVLSQLLFISAGISKIDTKSSVHKRTYPSGGARYPLELYPIILKGSSGLIEGIYHYNVKFHSLELLKKERLIDQVKDLTGKINEKVIENCSVLLVITAVFNRNEIKYGNRSYRYTLLECGHLAQNFCLTATALDLECCSIGGFLDNGLNKLMLLDDRKEQSLYLIALGKANKTK